MTRFALWFALAQAAISAGLPVSWVPARWDGGPVEVAHRTGDKALSDPAIREAISRWYDPATLSLLHGTPINCLLLTLSAGVDPKIEKRQWQLVKEYARRAHESGIAALGLVYAGADLDLVASATLDTQLDGVVLEGEFGRDLTFASRLEQRLRAMHRAALVIPITASRLLRKTAWPVMVVEGVSPGIGKADDSTVASATAGLWIDSNIWLARSFRARPERPVWISHRLRAGSPGIYERSIADAGAAGAHWIVALDDDFRTRLWRQENESVAAWRAMALELAFFEGRPEWRDFVPFGNIGIVLDASGPAADAEEFLNLVARRQIPYRVINRSELGASVLAGLRAVLAFGLEPTETERKILRGFAARGGLILTGPSWGGAPKDQSYAITAEGEGEIAVYKDSSPDPQSVARDLNDLVPTPELGVSIFKAPSVLSYVSTSADGRRMLIRLVNYASEPAESVGIEVTGQFRSARLEVPDQPPQELPLRRSGGRTELSVPTLRIFGAVLLE